MDISVSNAASLTIESPMLRAMAFIRAIHNLSKLFHWTVKGKDFYELHLLYDRIADTFDEELVDKIAETYFMASDCTESLYKVDQIAIEIESPYLMSSINYCPITALCNEINNLDILVNDMDTLTREDNTLFDEIAATCASMLALLRPIIHVEVPALETELFIPKGLPESVQRDGFVNTYLKECLGIPYENKLEESYDSRKALFEDVKRIVNDRKRARTLLMAGGNMPEDCNAEDEKLLCDM